MLGTKRPPLTTSNHWLSVLRLTLTGLGVVVVVVLVVVVVVVEGVVVDDVVATTRDASATR